MKTLCTILGLLYTFCAFSQIQLDSIVIFDEQYQEESEQFSFTYEDGKLFQFFLEYETELFVTVTIDYNDQGDFQMIEYLLGGDLQQQEFFYNPDGLLDSVKVTDPAGVDLLLEYFYVDDKISTFVYSQVTPEGEAVEALRDEYTYEGNTVEVSRQSLGQIVLKKYIYNNDEKLIYRSEGSTGFFYGDTLIYSDNSLNKILRQNGPLEAFSEVRDYQTEANVSFSDIDNPSFFFFRMQDIFSDDYSELSFPMTYGAKVNTSTSNSFFGARSEEWFYSVPTSTKESRVRATPISIYPNPTSEFIKLETEIAMESFVIYDLTGSIVKAEATSTDSLIQVSDLAFGSYTIVTKSSEGDFYFAQFVKQ